MSKTYTVTSRGVTSTWRRKQQVKLTATVLDLSNLELGKNVIRKVELPANIGNPECSVRSAYCSGGISRTFGYAPICEWHRDRKGLILPTKCKCKDGRVMFCGDWTGRRLAGEWYAASNNISYEKAYESAARRDSIGLVSCKTCGMHDEDPDSDSE
jgi:hypothetical protein